MPPIKRLTTKRLAISVTALLLALSFVLWLNRPRTSLDDVAKEYEACIERRDAACLMRLSMPSERKMYGLTEAKLQALLDRMVAPALGSPDPKSVVTVDESKDQGTYMLVKTWPRSGKPPVTSGVRVAVTPEGPRADKLVEGLILDSLAAKYRRFDGELHYLSLIRGLKAEGAELGALGFSGIDQGEGTLVPWDELSERWRAKLVARGVKMD